MSYGTKLTETYRLVGTYAGRILKGENAGDLPVIQSTRVELVVHLEDGQGTWADHANAAVGPRR